MVVAHLVICPSLCMLSLLRSLCIVFLLLAYAVSGPGPLLAQNLPQDADEPVLEPAQPMPSSDTDAPSARKSSFNEIDPVGAIGQEEYPNPALNFIPNNALRPAGDVNGDGLNDWVIEYRGVADERTFRRDDVVNKTLLRFGDTDFSGSTYSDVVYYRRLVPVGDFVGDSKADAIEFTDSGIDVYAGTPSGYASAPMVSVPGIVQNLEFGGDVDGDGFNDLVFETTATDEFVVVFGASTPSGVSSQVFAPAEQNPNPFFASVAVADINADGRAEIVRGEYPGSTPNPLYISVFEVDRSGVATIQNLVTNDVTQSYTDLEVEQLDNTGLPEIIFPNASVSRILTEDGSTGQYGPAFESIGREAIVIGDINDDGFGDIYQRDGAVHGITYGTGTLADYGSSTENGPIPFAFRVSEGGSGFQVTDVGTRDTRRFGDVDGDGTDDFLYTQFNVSGETFEQALYSEPASGFVRKLVNAAIPTSDYASTAVFQTEALPSWDGDASDDLAMLVRQREPEQPSADEVRIYFGDPATSPEADVAIQRPDDVLGWIIESGDFNDNGTPDLVVSWRTPTNTVEFYEPGSTTPYLIVDASDVDGSVNPPEPSDTFINVQNVGDVNGDGVEDLLMNAPRTNTLGVQLFLGGSGIDATPDVTIDYSGDGAIAGTVGDVMKRVGDVNDDGLDDFAIRAGNAGSMFSGDDFLLVHYGQTGNASTLNFDAPDARLQVVRDNQDQFYISFPSTVTAGDFNGDGVSDIAAVPVYFSLSGFLGQGDGGNAIRIYEGGAGFDGQADDKFPIPGGPFLRPEETHSFIRVHVGELSTLPDLDGDGSDEFLFGKEDVFAERASNAAIFTGNGSARPSINTVLKDPAGTGGLGSNNNNTFWSDSESAFGDFNGDGILEGVLRSSGDPNLLSDGAFVFSIGCALQSPATASETVSGSNPVATFVNSCSGIREIAFNGASGSGSVRVEQFPEPPATRDGIPTDANVSQERFVIGVAGGFAFTDADITVPLSSLSGITDPTTITAYRRSTAGSGTFSALPTVYDVQEDAFVVTTTTFSEFVFASTDNPLPVELSRFEVQPAGAQSATLTWSTLSETSNGGFRVQHRLSGESSGESATWKTLGFVNGAGTTTEAMSYRFDATNLEPGTHRFRLEQIDADGTPSLSPERTARISMNGPLFLSAPAPHPVQDRSRLAFAVEEGGPATVTLYNLLGQRVATLHDGPVTAGERVALTINAGRLGAGTYFLRLTTDTASRTERVTVVR